MDKSRVNKDLILREKLAIERTRMALERTFLSYVRTALYFSIAGMSIKSFLMVPYATLIEIVFWVVAGIILGIGIFQTLKQHKKLKTAEKHIGNYILDFENN